MKKNQIVCFFSLLLSLPLFGQIETDYGMWNSLEIGKKFENGFSLSFEEEFRLRNALKTVDKFQSTLELKYKFTSYLDAGASYTMINYFRPSDQYHPHNFWELRHRSNLFVETDAKLGRFSFALRERFQSTYRMLDAYSTAKTNPKHMLRSKLSADYNVKGIPLEPYASLELFHVLNGNKKGEQEKYRIAAGLKYKLNESWSVKVGYVYADETDEEDGDREHVLQLGLNWKL